MDRCPAAPKTQAPSPPCKRKSKCQNIPMVGSCKLLTLQWVIAGTVINLKCSFGSRFELARV